MTRSGATRQHAEELAGRATHFPRAGDPAAHRTLIHVDERGERTGRQPRARHRLLDQRAVPLQHSCRDLKRLAFSLAFSPCGDCAVEAFMESGRWKFMRLNHLRRRNGQS